MAAPGSSGFESLQADDLRATTIAAAESSPPGPDVGEVADGVIPVSSELELEYRLYRPATPGPHPIVVYFHGGGWVLGSHVSNDPLCRDMCVRTQMMIVSVNYRHAPEHPFPVATDDGFEALRWVAAKAGELGGIPGQVSVMGYSAGGNIAAVACQRARDRGGPRILVQILMNPVLDCDLERASYEENGTGYGLTTMAMRWFWDQYCPDVSQRKGPVASPLRAESLIGLPPTVIVTGEFDPLRDEGDEYAAKLGDAGVPVRHIRGPRTRAQFAVDGGCCFLRRRDQSRNGRSAAGDRFGANE
jgi:acetyl esterase/lipase